MRIYLIRHGEAVSEEIDPRNPLSENGKQDIERIGKFLAALKIQPVYFFHSEKLRAIQTAEIIAKCIHYQGQLESRSELDPLGLVSPISSEINQSSEDMVFVGHMPFMGKLVSKLITGYENNDIVAFQTGTVACLEKNAGSYWIVRWVVSPELFRQNG